MPQWLLPRRDLFRFENVPPSLMRVEMTKLLKLEFEIKSLYRMNSTKESYRKRMDLVQLVPTIWKLV